MRDFCKAAFDYAGLDIERHLFIDSALFRPAEVDVLCGDPAKARASLGWRPEITLEAMIAEMVDADLSRLKPR